MEYESERTKQAREKLKASLKSASPEVRQAFKETIEEMRKPENVEKTVNNICAGMQVIKTVFDVAEKAKAATKDLVYFD